MSEDVVELPAEEADAPKAAEKQWVVWDHQWDFQTRELRPRDLVSFGAEESEDEPLSALEWNAANRWRVPRADIPLTDLQLGQLLGLEKSFRLVDH